MEFRPSHTIDGRTAIELWDGPHRVATIYAQRAGLHIVFDPPYEPDQHTTAIEVQQPIGFLLGIAEN